MCNGDSGPWELDFSVFSGTANTSAYLQDAYFVSVNGPGMCSGPTQDKHEISKPLSI